MSQNDDETESGGVAELGLLGLVTLAPLLIVIAGLWKLFAKAGVPGWGAIVPIYNLVLLLRITGKPFWWIFPILLASTALGNPFLLLLLAFFLFSALPVIFFVTLILGIVAGAVMSIFVSLSLAHCFGKSTGYGLGIIFFPFIFLPMLGFSSAQYQGGTSDPTRSTMPTANQAPKRPKSVLEKVRPPRRSLGEYLQSQDGRAAMMTYFVSTVLHALVLFLLALVVLDKETIENLFNIVSKPPEEVVQDEEIFQALEQPEEIYNDSFEDNPQDSVATDIVEETTPLQLDINDLEPSIEIDDEAFQSLAEIAKEGEFGGRSTKGKKGLVKSQGGNEASEAAVVRGLKWLANIQLPDGSWSFSEIGESPDAGDLNNCQMGATGMALMAFLGAGHTHKKDGPYKNVVMGGLSYLMNNARLTPAGADFRAKSGQGNMYVQGICVIALSEAYGMTKDAPLRRAAEGGIAFIINAQDSKGGGWRYQPKQAGDTSVVGWQVMALVSARGAKIPVPRNVVAGANAFLDFVQVEDDNFTYYGYDKPSKKLSTSSIGLLCRMYLGWDVNNEKLKKGIAYLANSGPSKNNEYYNYYATQVMHHWGGETWTKWNNVMRDQLIDTQSLEGVDAGSWRPAGAAGPGGRLYATVLNIMSLEVYYRHLPLYQRNAVQADF